MRLHYPAFLAFFFTCGLNFSYISLTRFEFFIINFQQFILGPGTDTLSHPFLSPFVSFLLMKYVNGDLLEFA